MKNRVNICFAFFILFASSTFALPPPLTIKNAEIVNSINNKPIVIHGINWFGFNNGQTMVDGLWAGGTSAAIDFGTVIFQLRLLGFNAIRLPFTFTDLQMPTFNKKMQCQVLSLEDLYSRTRTSSSRLSVPDGSHVTTSGSECNTYLPHNTITIERFVWVIRECVRQGMYVVIDYHGMGMESYHRDPNSFVREWFKVWQYIVNKPYFYSELNGRIVIDIINEPDSMGLKWNQLIGLYMGVMDKFTTSMAADILDESELSNDMLPSGTSGEVWRYFSFAEHMLNAIFPFVTFDWKNMPQFLMNTNQIDMNGNLSMQSQVKPNVLFMIEGTGQVSWNMNWGDGFVTNKTIVGRENLDDPNEFFRILEKKPYANKVIISPHIYGPSITRATKAYKGYSLFERLEASFGHWVGKFPIVIGEFGTMFEDVRDLELLSDFSKWLTKKKIGNWIFWNYAQNGGDTRNLVHHNFQDLDWKVIQWLKDFFKL